MAEATREVDWWDWTRAEYITITITSSGARSGTARSAGADRPMCTRHDRPCGGRAEAWPAAWGVPVVRAGTLLRVWTTEVLILIPESSIAWAV